MAETSKVKKEGSGKDPSFLFGLIVLGITTLLVAGAFGLPAFIDNARQASDPIYRFIHDRFLACRDDGRCPKDAAGWESMVPDVFAVGEPRDQVVERLRRAGFEDWGVYERELHYHRLGASIGLFCTKYYNVRVTFDASNKLATADGTFSGTPNCL